MVLGTWSDFWGGGRRGQKGGRVKHQRAWPGLNA